MTKIDFKKQIATYSATRGKFDLVTVPAMQYLMIDGYGDPNSSQSYADALATLYPIAYKLKFFSKIDLGRDYTVMPLEALWWAEDMSSFTANRDKSTWSWTVMIMTPEWITQDHFTDVIAKARIAHDLPAIDAIRLETLDEGQAVQILHIGPYDDEGPILATMHNDVIPTRSLRMTGKHHEIYLSDPRRAAPEKLKTILRQPVRSVVGG